MSLPRPGRLSDIKEKEGNVLEERLLGESNPATISLVFNHLTRNDKKNAFLKRFPKEYFASPLSCIEKSRN